MTQYLALKILRDGHPTETALQAILNDYTILPIATEEVQFGIKGIRDDRGTSAIGVDNLTLTPAQQHRAFHVLDLLEGFGDGIEYARLAAGINFIRYGTADEDRTDLIKLFASYYYGAEEAGAWEGEEGDHESEAELDIRRIMADCAALDAAGLFAENAKNAPQGENWVAGFRAHQAGNATRAKNAQVDADQIGGLSTATMMNLLAETIEVLEPFYEANYGDDGLSTLTAADLKKAHDHSIKIATLLPDHIPDVGNMVEAQPQLHCMVDLETLGIKPGSVIRSIGAVIFDPHGTGIIAQYYRNISLESAQTYGLTIDDATLTWWENQSPEARAALQTDQRHLVVALSEFEDFWKSQNATHFWSHGANFDEVLLKAAFDAVPAAVPWQYYNVMCSRTLFTLAGNKPDRAKGTHHNALDDASNQALAVQEAYRRLRIPRPAPRAPSHPNPTGRLMLKTYCHLQGSVAIPYRIDLILMESLSIYTERLLSKARAAPAYGIINLKLNYQSYDLPLDCSKIFMSDIPEVGIDCVGMPRKRHQTTSIRPLSRPPKTAVRFKLWKGLRINKYTAMAYNHVIRWMAAMIDQIKNYSEWPNREFLTFGCIQTQPRPELVMMKGLRMLISAYRQYNRSNGRDQGKRRTCRSHPLPKSSEISSTNSQSKTKKHRSEKCRNENDKILTMRQIELHNVSLPITHYYQTEYCCKVNCRDHCIRVFGRRANGR